MNDARAKEVGKILDALELLNEQLGTILKTESAYFDQLDESEIKLIKGQRSLVSVESLKKGMKNIEEAIDHLGDIDYPE